MRDYARIYHTSVTDLEKRRLFEFMIDYAEAAEDLAKEAEQRRKNMPKHFGRGQQRR